MGAMAHGESYDAESKMVLALEPIMERLGLSESGSYSTSCAISPKMSWRNQKEISSKSSTALVGLGRIHGALVETTYSHLILSISGQPLCYAAHRTLQHPFFSPSPWASHVAPSDPLPRSQKGTSCDNTILVGLCCSGSVSARLLGRAVYV